MKYVSFVLVRPSGVQTIAIWCVKAQCKSTVFASSGVSKNRLQFLSLTVNEMLGRYESSKPPFKFGRDITVGQDFLFFDNGCYVFTSECPSLLNVKL